MGRMVARTIVITLSVTLAIQILVSVAAVTVPIFAPTAAKDIGISATNAGLYVGLIYVTGMLSSLWSAGFIARYGPLRISQLCLVLCGVGLGLTASGSPPLLILSALVLGIGYGPVTPASSQVLSRTTPAQSMSFIFSLKQTGVPLGGALAGAVVPILVLSAGWRATALIVGAACAIAALLLEPVRPEIDVDLQPGRSISLRGLAGPLKLVASRRPLLRLAIITFFYGGMQLCLTTYLVIYLTDKIGMALIAAGLTLSAAQMAGTIGRIIWGFVADRLLRPHRVLGLIGLMMSAGAAATACFSPAWPYAAVWVSTVFFGASAIGWNGVYLAEAARLAPVGQVSAATGGSLFFTFLGVVAGPPVFAAIAALSASYAPAFFVFAAFTFVCAIVIGFGGVGRKQDQK